MSIKVPSRLIAVLIGAAAFACAAPATDAGSIAPPPPPAPPSSPVPVPLRLVVTPTSRRATAQPGASAPSDNAAITLTGDGATTTSWTATSRHSWIVLRAATGTGSGTMTWDRTTTGLDAGMHVDTITVSATGILDSPATVIDSFEVTTAAAPLALVVSPAGRSVSVSQGAAAPDDNVAITLTGDGAAATAWSASGAASWQSLAQATGTGSGVLAWHRNSAGLAVGLHVDTLLVSAPGAAGSPGRVIDSLRITTAVAPTALSVAPTSRSITVAAGSTAAATSATVTLTGDNSGTIVWVAAGKKAWTLLTMPTGVGSGTISWTRATSNLAAGTYVDTITVTAAVTSGSPARIIDTIVVTPVSQGVAPDLGLNADMHGLIAFPLSSLWNQPVDTAQVDPSSDAILGAIGLTTSLHPDFGANFGGGPFGIPYIVVPDNQSRYSLSFDYADESDPGPYPIPPNPPIEPGGGDDHLLVITQGEQKLYELYALSGSGATWHAGSGAIWDLIRGTTRPAGWTSADAAGLPIFPGLVRYDEVYLHGVINHALRFTVVHTRDAWVAPASHAASSSSSTLYAPMGMRVRLKAGFDISGFPAPAQVILVALKKYGMMVADNGSNFYLSGTADARWNDDINNTLKQVKVSDFEVIRMAGVVTQ